MLPEHFSKDLYRLPEGHSPFGIGICPYWMKVALTTGRFCIYLRYIQVLLGHSMVYYSTLERIQKTLSKSQDR